MKKLIFTVALLLTFITLLAQKQIDKSQFGVSDKRAGEILDKVSKKYKSYKTIKAAFTLIIDSPEDNINEQQTGTLYLKGNKYKLELGGQQIICDNTTLWTYLKDANEVQVNSYEPDENTVTPDKLFTIYEDDFLYGLGEEVVENGKSIQVIQLTPYDKSKPYFKIKLFVDKDTWRIIRFKIYEKNGNRYIYKISQFKPNIKLSDSFFSFDIANHPDVEVIDLR